MELVNRLETRIYALLRELQHLREVNARLEDADVRIAGLQEENRLLADELEKEKILRASINERIEKLLAGIQEYEQGSRTGGVSAQDPAE
jgi:cell shape-determining protein MreC